MVRPAERRGLVRWLIDQKQISRRKACRWRSRVRVGLSRNALSEPVAIKDKDKALASRIEQLARRHKQWGVLNRAAGADLSPVAQKGRVGES